MKDGEFRCTERFLDATIVRCCRFPGIRLLELVKWIDFDISHFEWVKHVHCDSISALVGEMTTNPNAQSLRCLPHINRFTIVIIEDVYATFCVVRYTSLIVLSIKKPLKFALDFRDLIGHTAL